MQLHKLSSRVHLKCFFFSCLCILLTFHVNLSAQETKSIDYTQTAEFKQCWEDAYRNKITSCSFWDGVVSCEGNWRRWNCQHAADARYEASNVYCETEDASNISTDVTVVLHKICDK